MDEEKKQGKESRQRGWHAEQKKDFSAQKMPQAVSEQRVWSNDLPEGWSSQAEGEATNDLAEVMLSHAAKPSPFSVLLGSLLKNDRNEILRIARGVGVSDITIYRWLNGMSAPRYAHMQRLVDVLAQSSQASHSAQQGNARNAELPAGRWDVPRELYRRVLEQAATTADDASRCWHIIETIFEHALLFFDPDHRGLALTYARLMPPRADGSIHSLYEAEMRGQAPWPFALDFKTYLGSTTLAGASAMSLRVRVWSKSEAETRTPVGIDEHERSACAAPVMRGTRLAGVLVVSSTVEDFVTHPAVPRAVNEFANLLAAGLMDSDFYPSRLVRLVPMPDLGWQRDKIARLYLNRVVDYARKQCLSFPEAEHKVLQDLEEEFECYAAGQSDILSEQVHEQIEQPW